MRFCYKTHCKHVFTCTLFCIWWLDVKNTTLIKMINNWKTHKRIYLFIYLFIYMYSARHNYTGMAPKRRFFCCPPPRVENGIEQFWHMDMVDMVIIKNWFSGRTSRSVHNGFKRPDLGLRWDFTLQVSRPDKTNPTPRGRFLNFTLRVQLWHAK